MKVHKFNDSLLEGKRGEEIAFKLLRKRFLLVDDVRDDLVFQKKDVDFLVDNGCVLGVDVKFDSQMSRTGNLFFEEWSNVEKGTVGCFLGSEADFWLYGDGECWWWLHLESVRGYVLSNKGCFDSRVLCNKGDGFEFRSKGWLVPLGVLLGVGLVKKWE